MDVIPWMIDTFTYGITVVVASGILSTATALFVALLVFPRARASGRMRDSLVHVTTSGTKSGFDLLLSIPSALLSYSFQNIAATLLLLLCVGLHVAISVNGEASFLRDLGPTYAAVNSVWTNAFIDPLVGLLTVLYGAGVGLVNFVVHAFREILYGTISVLSFNGQSPFVLLRALFALPLAAAKLVSQVFTVFEVSEGRNWLVNEFDMKPAIAIVQTDLIDKVVDQSQYMCAALAPSFFIARDVLTSDALSGFLNGMVNVVWSGMQAVFRVFTPQYHTLDPKPVFKQLRAIGYYTGGMLDDVLQASLNLGAMQIASSERVVLPRPSAGMGVGRALAFAVSSFELPVSILVAVLGGGDVYAASDATAVANQARLSVTSFAAGAHHLSSLALTGSPSKKTRLDCPYYGYNFFTDPTVLGSIPAVCVCEEGQCGRGDCTADGTCACLAGHHHVVPDNGARACVQRCDVAGEEYIAAYKLEHGGMPHPLDVYRARCGTTGTCGDDGYCTCLQDSVLDLRTGKCGSNSTIPSYAQVSSADDCSGLLTHELGPVVECATQSALLSSIGTAFTAWSLMREVVFRFPSVHTFDRLLQTFTGMHYSRMDSVSCEYRRDLTGAFDMTIDPSNCVCDLPETSEAADYNPWCAQPTLNADVFSHMDAFAFYAGRKIPAVGLQHLKFVYPTSMSIENLPGPKSSARRRLWDLSDIRAQVTDALGSAGARVKAGAASAASEAKHAAQNVYVGGTGAQFGFLADTLGVWATTSARGGIEFWRMCIKGVASLWPLVISMGKFVIGSDVNFMHLPENCDWGTKFDGPVRPRYTNASAWDSVKADLVSEAKQCNCGGSTPLCTTRTCDRMGQLVSVPKPVLLSQAVRQLNLFDAALQIKRRNDPFIGTPCKQRAYRHNSEMCTGTNYDSSCQCNVDLELASDTTCQCIAYYPRKQAIAQDMDGFFKSSFMANFYSGKVPWCNSMLYEFVYFYQMSASIGVQNMLARLDSSDPLSAEVDSPCYSSDNTYSLARNTILTRLFQPNPRANGHIFVGDQGGDIHNTTICNILKGLDEIRWIRDVPGGVEFAGRGSCLSLYDAANASHRCIEGPYSVRKLALLGFENPYGSDDLLCFYDSSHSQDAIAIRAITTQHFGGSHALFCSAVLGGGLTGIQKTYGEHTFAYDATRWMDIPQYKAGVKGHYIATGVSKLHPQTCGFLEQNDNLVFQPCAHECITEGGINRCWCDITVHHDFLCNMGNMYRQHLWESINWARQKTTRLISKVGFIVGGLSADKTVNFCDWERTTGSACALVASAVTGQSKHPVAEKVRTVVAKILFNVWEVTVATPHLAAWAQESLMIDIADSMFDLGKGKTCDGGLKACQVCESEDDCNPTATYTVTEGSDGPWSGDDPYGGLGCYAEGKCPEDCENHPPWLFSSKCYVPGTRCVDKGNCIRSQCIPSAIKCSAPAQGLGRVAFNKYLLPYKVGMAQFCTALISLQDIAYASNMDLDGSDIIPAIMDFINTVVGLFDRTFGNLAVLLAQAVGGFLGVLHNPDDTVRWGAWMKNILTLVTQLAQLLLNNAMEVIGVAFEIIPDPLGRVAQSVLGSMCLGINYGIGGLLYAIEPLPGLGAVLPENTFLNPSPVDQCLSGKNTYLGKSQSKLIEKDYKRRRLSTVGSNETEYHYWRTHANWTGDTMCARYGRRAEAPVGVLEYEVWRQCVMNRHRVDIMSTVLDVDYIPWTLLDDWWEPLTFGTRVVHGIFILLTSGEASLHRWSELGYPVQASIDIIRHLEALELDMGLSSLVKELFKLRHREAGDTAHHVIAIADAVANTSFPSLLNRKWGSLHRRIYDGANELAAGLVAHAQFPRRASPVPVRPRRLQEEYAAESTFGAEENMCEDGRVCMDCALLETSVNTIVDTAVATGEYYTDVYPHIVDNFLDTVAHWESTNPDSPYAIFPDVKVPYRPKPIYAPQPPASLTLAAVRPLEDDVDLVEVLKDFFTVTDDRPVDLFEHGLWYYLEYLLRPCEALRMGFGSCTLPKYTTGDAATLTLRVMAGLWATGWLVGLQLPFVIQVPVVLFVFMAFRYDYVPRCLPVMPVCLMTDIQYMITQATPACLCQLVPALVINSDMCTDVYCTDSVIQYRSCPDRQLGVLWPIVFGLRWQAPIVFDLLFASQYSPLAWMEPYVVEMRTDMRDGIPVSDLDVTCFALKLFDVLLVVLAFKLVGAAMGPGVRATLGVVVSSMGSLFATAGFLAGVPGMVTKGSITWPQA